MLDLKPDNWSLVAIQVVFIFVPFDFQTVDTPRSTPTSSSASSHTKRNRTIHNMKKLFNKDKKKASTGDLSDFHAAQQPGHTLDRIVSLKAEVRHAQN